MDRNEISSAIQCELQKRGKSVRNKNAIKALFSALPGPVEALSRIFLGPADALSLEKIMIAQDVMLDLLCRIDEAISAARSEAEQRGLDWRMISVEIDVRAEDTEEATGMEISSNSGPVELKPGTTIHVEAKRVGRATGLKIGDESTKEKGHQ